jgi:hypothetical protein
LTDASASASMGVARTDAAIKRLMNELHS